MIKLLKTLIYLSAALYLGAMAWATFTQRDMIFHPNASYRLPEEIDEKTPFTELTVKTEDGLSLKGWYAPASKKAATIVFFHGNADHLQNLMDVAAPYLEDGYGFLLAEYRGYSLMPGKPTESGLHADARAYLSALFDRGVDMGQIVLMGHSLGTSVAAQAAKEFHTAGLILLAPMTSMVALADAQYPYFPTNLLVIDRFETDKLLSSLTIPLLIIHGNNDQVVPLSHGQKLFSLANEPKALHVLEGRNHSDLFESAIPFVTSFVDDVVKP